MNSLLDIAEQILIDRIISNKAPVTGESKAKMVLVTLSGILGLAGIGVILYGIFLWLSVNYSQQATMMIMGSIMILLSIFSGLSIYAIQLYKRKQMQIMKAEVLALFEDSISVFEKELSRPVNDNPKTAILASSIVGYLAGERFL
jgi:hypothetical protein